MSFSIRILADENISYKLVLFLRENGIDIKYASKGMKNSSLFSIASKEKRILLTHDSDFLNASLYPSNSCTGIIVLSVHPPELSKMQSLLLIFLEKLSKGSAKGKIFVITETGAEVSG